MELRQNEYELYKGKAETMYFNTIRKKRGKLTVTNERVFFTSFLSKPIVIELNEIQSFVCYNVTLFLPFGIRINKKNGGKFEIATLSRKKASEALTSLLNGI